MKYTVKKGAVVLAVPHDNKAPSEHTLRNRDRTYFSAKVDGDFYVFEAQQPSRWKEFRVHLEGVSVEPDPNGIPDGIYTVRVGPNQDQVTVKLQTVDDIYQPDGATPNFFFNKQVVSFLDGTGGATTFTARMHIDEFGGTHVWKQFRRDPSIERYRQALATLAETLAAPDLTNS